MLKIKEESTDVGVIIGRFQVHTLHTGQKELIESVIEKHDKVLVFLGLSPLKNTDNNPLNYLCRERMLKEEFEEDFEDKLEINYIEDERDDVSWSNNLDKKIERFTNPGQSIVLYGSRDSFIKCYSGKFKTIEFDSDITFSGSKIREKIKNNYPLSEAYRAGIIAATGQRFPTTYITVDIAILNEGPTKVLLGKKANESQWRFVGGFAEPNSDSFEQDAKREVAEETGLEVGEIKYICSKKVEDWRYRSEKDSVKTIFYKAVYLFGSLTPRDDIKAVKWFWIKDIKMEEIVPEHHALMEALFDNLKIKKNGKE